MKVKKVAKRRLNMVLLTLDALRPDHLGVYGYERKTDVALKPYLNQMAVFKNAYAYSNNTVRSFPAILCSIWPGLCKTKYLFEYVKKTWLPEFCQTLPELFLEQGYYTAAHTCWTNYLTDQQGFGRGFRDFFGFLRQDEPKRRITGRSLFSKCSRLLQYGLRFMPSRELVRYLEKQFHWIRETANTIGFNVEQTPGTGGRSADEVTNYLLHRIERNRDEPFFVWGHYLDTHMPFSHSKTSFSKQDITPQKRRAINQALFNKKALSHTLHKTLLEIYDSEIMSLFQQIDRIFYFLKRHRLLQDTCVIITSDHGQGFWEHGYWECPEDQFYDESIKVPLLIYHPRLFSKSLMVDTPVSLIDLAPTILDLCEIPWEGRFFGKSFHGILRGRDEVPVSGPIWVETVGPPKYCCSISNGNKTVYNFDTASILYGLNHLDEWIPPEQIDSLSFLESLCRYEDEKVRFLSLLRRKGGTPSPGAGWEGAETIL